MADGNPQIELINVDVTGAETRANTVMVHNVNWTISEGDYWIVGGLPKSDELDECAPHFDHVVAAYTIGEAGPHFADILSPAMHVERSEMLCEAMQRAIAAAKPGDTILLSPACASFDQFKDYEARGDSFRQLVASLTGAKVAVPEAAA